jgi:hypothetical protein
MASVISEEVNGKEGGDKNTDPAIARLEVYVGLAKFLIGTVALGAVTLFFNEQYRNAQLDLEKEKSNHALLLQERKAEVEYLSKFVTNAMDKDIKVRVDFADYMKSVALSDTLQKIWSKYFDVLSKKQEEGEQRIKVLEAQKQEAANKLAAVNPAQNNEGNTRQLLEQLQKLDRDLYLVQDSLDRKRYGTFDQNYFDYQRVYADAAVAERAGNYAQQRDLLASAIDRVPDAVKPYFQARLADAYRSLHDFSNANKAMQEAVALRPTASNLINLAIMQKNNKHVDLALESLSKALKLAQGSQATEIEIIIAGYLIHNGQRDEGIRRFAGLQPRLQPRDEFITNIAWFDAVADKKAEFYEAFERSLEVNRDATLTWIDQEVDIDKYRNEERFKQLVSTARAE